MKHTALVSLLAASLFMPVAAWADSAVSLHGTGATTVTKLYGAWAGSYGSKQALRIAYKPTGSGEGIRAMRAREADFGATDEPLSPDQLREAHLAQIPTVVMGLVPVVNLPRIGAGQLRLDGPVLADVFLGSIKTWNDPRIAALNPQLALPALPVTRVVSSQSSGTTGTFTGYLARFSADWKSLAGKQPKWPGEVKGAPGTDAVVAAIQATPGAIGVVGYDRVQAAGLASVALKNAAGQFVNVSTESMLAAVRGSGLRDNLNAQLINAGGAGVWPLTTLTYVLLDARPKTPQATGEVMRFFAWALANGDSAVRGQGFLPLPPNVQAAAFSSLSGIRTADGQRLSVNLGQMLQ